MMKYSLFITAILATASEAAPIVSNIHAEPSITCGPERIYTQSDIQMAVFGACAHMRAGTTAGGTHYPHEFKNYENLPLDGEGPYVAFPLLTDTIYPNGYPGRDRVVIGKSCAVANVVTSIDKERHGFRFIECNMTLPVEIEAPRVKAPLFKAHLVEASEGPEEVGNPTLPPEVKASGGPEEVGNPTLPVEVKAPREPEKVGNPTLPVEVEARRGHQDVGNRAIYGAAERLWSAEQIEGPTAA